jgi:two-component system alkaline phosphatase synthesis response regulator PhoP/two-component system response regulator VicR
MSDRKRKILVTDDEPPVVQIIRTNLLIEGYEVLTAYDGVECLQKVASEKPDLVILDVMMPRKDGWAVLEELKNSPETENLPVVMLTALGGVSDMDRGARLGNDCYLTKPFEPIELIAIVRRLLEAGEEDQIRR